MVGGDFTQSDPGANVPPVRWERKYVGTKVPVTLCGVLPFRRIPTRRILKKYIV